MPLRDFKCLSCELLQERVYWASKDTVDGKPKMPTCEGEGCDSELEMLPLSVTITKSAVFPFTSTNVDGSGTPIVIESMGDLRNAEKKYGVCFTGFSNNDSNLDTPKDLPEMRPGGEEYRGNRFR